MLPFPTFAMANQSSRAVLSMSSQKYLWKIWGAPFYSPYHHFSASKSNVIIRLNHMKLTFFSDTNSHIFTIHVFQPKFFFLLFPNSLVLHYSKRSPSKTHIWSYFTLVSPLQWFSTVPLIVSKFFSVTYGILLSCSLLISLASFFGSFHPCNFAHLDPGLLYV